MTHIPAHPTNYRAGRTREIDHIVLHYTAGDGDTAENNGRYFAGENRNASCHYFVDEEGWILSVREEDTAWHAGNWDMNCRSIGVELCSKKDKNGKYFIPEETLQQGKILLRELIARYKIPESRFLRHYDVTGKLCPMPMVEDEHLWRRFKEELYSPNEPSSWAKEACDWALARGLILGDGQGNFLWQEPVTREQLMTILHRFHQTV